MAGTKILNVQKSDSFDEVFDAFKQAEAQEVIFIFPKGSVFAQDASYFETIKKESEATGKTVNVMSSDPLIAHLATQNGLGVLQNPAPKTRRVAPRSIPEPEPQQPVQEVATPEQEAPQYPMAQEAVANLESELVADLTMARKAKPAPQLRKSIPPPMITPSGRRIRDIVSGDQDTSLDVEQEKEKDVEVEISRTSVIPPVAPSPAPIASTLGSTDIEKLWAEEERRQNPDGSTDENGKATKNHTHISKKFIFIPVGIAVIALIVIVLTTVGHARIIIKPQMEPIEISLKVAVSPKTQTVDVELSRIPGQLFDISKEEKGNYALTSTKEVAQKAYGNVTIFNKSSAVQRLVATTRLESKDGLIFRIPETINVPANGSIESRVYADRPGKEYNITATQFTIPGLKDTPKYGDFSATSSTAMAGGFIGSSTVVTEQDITKAQLELSAKAKENVLVALKEQANGLKVFDDVTISIGDPITNAKTGEAAEKLEMSVSGRVSVIAFRESDIHELIKHYLSKNGGLDLLLDGLTIEYLKQVTDKTSQTLSFDAHVTGESVAKIDKNKILKDIPGMKESAVTAYFKDTKELIGSATHIQLSPFWVRSVPKNAKKIEIIVDTKQ